MIIILDNSVTAMTGQQPNPGTGYGPSDAPKHKIQIENVLKGMGVENIVINNSFDVKTSSESFQKLLENKGPTVVISRGACALWNDRNKRKRGEKVQPFYVDNEICRKCHTCMKDFFCPAITMETVESQYIDDKGKLWKGYSSHISTELCNGCGVCSILCPYTDHENRSEKDVIQIFSKEREVRHDL